jgi:Mrp family chromosome partitioning ATPase
VAGRALDILAAGASFNQVVEQSAVTAAVTLAKASAQAAVEAAADARSPVVVLRMNAGTVLAVDSSHAADVVVLDADIYGSELPDLTDVGGELYRVTERAANARLDTEGAGADFVSDVLAHLGEAEGARIAALEVEEEADTPRA